ncbi:protein phosphatase, putative [Plasmodium vivax]|uniref:Protein phosphatase n=6 Tax=Plasmodium vivax TaxID=5855 RepID=A5K7C0_PLAVS|nr:protein phosphatase 2C, putative [Plasmodium vivax]KMZ80825.1 protein phosphatase 2C [Plasmodium vivax India VII]KMZ86958.1 protein phosphatase 2C [Plasmodium vivax Brazil I]KMZ93391.1 protein phosphatase 2C [Plasmodium vivax Mauritania I]KNA00057.1 protein phosphatase 2C [Plasmodium vivax North Korean]EDL44679.1 protein phosphatase 2C, putative [Plasmodium vivax]|eukprot:XP_001614406.1 protein phosphatase 2C [Plasmodium vivax Sal-1]
MITTFFPLLVVLLNNMLTCYPKRLAHSVYAVAPINSKRKMNYLLKKEDCYFYRQNLNFFSKEFEKKLKKNKKTKNELGMKDSIMDKLSFLPTQGGHKSSNFTNTKCDTQLSNNFSKELNFVTKLPCTFLKNKVTFNFFNMANSVYLKYKIKKNILFSFNKKAFCSSGKHSILTNYKIIKHPDKVESEDCCLNGKGFMAIADGVGSWIRHGVNPRKYPEKFLQLLQKKMDENENMKIEDVLNYAYLNNDIEGSTTVCLIIFNNNSTISTAVIGDSQFILIRNDNIIYRSKPQQYEFNFPYQLGSNEVSKPNDADIAHIEVKKNDIIVAGSDGLWDNLYDNQILNLVKQNNFSSLSEKIANEAFNYSKMKRWMSPYINNYNKEFKCHKTGGKMDDITVSCALIC